MINEIKDDIERNEQKKKTLRDVSLKIGRTESILARISKLDKIIRGLLKLKCGRLFRDMKTGYELFDVEAILKEKLKFLAHLVVIYYVVKYHDKRVMKKETMSKVDNSRKNILTRCK